MARNAPFEERFWSQVNKTDTCWLWTGTVNMGGYGRLMRAVGEKPRLILAHRASYELHVGPIPVDRYVLHKCDTPACVRPDHLWLGTYKDNRADAAAKGRLPRGERANNAKLTEAQVLEIWHTYKPYKVTAKAFAERFGVNRNAIRDIMNGRCWKHLTGAGITR